MMNWIRNNTVVWEELDGCALLVDAKSGSRWHLNEAASCVWRMCDGGHTLAELARALRQPGTVIAQFCGQFESLGLLNPVAGMAAGMTLHTSPTDSPFNFQKLGLGAGPRRRPSPRGVSGPG